MSGLDCMKKRMLYDGRNDATQDGRNVTGKYKSFKSALLNSYQAENITFKEQPRRCLINPDKLKENYDQKEISIDFDADMHNGDTFYWDRTNTHWLVYLQRYEEEAYFRAQIRRCDYEVDINGHRYWVYVRGPVETAIIWRQKHKIEFNDLNYSILLYITKNDETDEFFTRFQKMKFDGHNWRVAAVDRYSQDGIIEVYLEEYYDNDMEDEMIPLEPEKPNPKKPHIEGPQIVRPYDTNLCYSIVGITDGLFVVNSNKVKISQTIENKCILEITTSKSGKFDLIYKKDGEDDIVLPIDIQSL